MNDTQLGELLRQRDRQAGPPEGFRIERERIRGRARRRQRIRTVGVAGLMVLLVLVFWGGAEAWRHHDRGALQGQEAQRVARLEAEVARLRADTEALLSVVADLATRQREREQWARIQRSMQQMPAPQQQMHQLVNQAAAALVDRAEVLWPQPERRAAARELYRLTLRLYPDSEAAETARRRLQESNSNTFL